MNVEYGSRLNEPAVMPAKDILKMATENGLPVYGRRTAAGIEIGKKADLITVNMMQPPSFPPREIR